MGGEASPGALDQTTKALLEDAGFPSPPTGEAKKINAQLRRSARHSALSALISADIFAVGIAIIGGQLIDWGINGRPRPLDSLASLIYLPVFLLIMGCYGLYRRGRRRLVGSSFPDFSQLIHSLVASSLVVLFAAAGLHRWIGLPNVDRTAAAFIALLALGGVPQSRAIARWLIRRPAGAQSKVLIVGSGVVASRVVARLQRVDGVDVVGFIDDSTRISTEVRNAIPLLGGLDEMPRLVADLRVDQIVVAFTPATGAKLSALLRDMAADVQISIVPRLFDLLTVRSHVDDLYGLPVVDVAPASLGPADRFAKRALDIVASSIGLLLLSIPLLVIAIRIKTSSAGSVFFSQGRTGRRGKTFNIYKFRTMQTGAEQMKVVETNDVDGPLYKLKEDPRVTPVGRFLRKTSLDEMPQLFNVLKGDMSLVGPRPFITSESAEIDGWAARRFDVRPGMTGLWQVSGRNDLEFEELCRLDYSYVASWSLWWDVRILWHTPTAVLMRRGAY